MNLSPTDPHYSTTRSKSQWRCSGPTGSDYATIWPKTYWVDVVGRNTCSCLHISEVHAIPTQFISTVASEWHGQKLKVNWSDDFSDCSWTAFSSYACYPPVPAYMAKFPSFSFLIKAWTLSIEMVRMFALFGAFYASAIDRVMAMRSSTGGFCRF